MAYYYMFVIILAGYVYSQVPYIQVQSLQTLYNATNGPKWLNKDNFNIKY
jgi:hypothetical protein